MTQHHTWAVAVFYCYMKRAASHSHEGRPEVKDPAVAQAFF
jgi:hypothetical protein